MRFQIKGTKEEEIKKEINKILMEFSSYNMQVNKKYKPSAIVKPVSFEDIDISYLLSLNGKDFLKEAYNIILGREPDPQGLQFFLSKLYSGEYTKGDVIVHLRLSKEGRNRKVKIKGLYKLIIPFFLKRVPLLNKIYEFAKILLFPEKIYKRLSALENFSYTHILELNHIVKEEVDKVVNQVDKIKEEMKMKLDRLNELESKVKELEKIKVKDIWFENLDFKINDNKKFYKSFEDALRGSRLDIKNRQRIYIDVLKKEGIKGPVLDAGCGRGEFLELLKQEGLNGLGVDIDKDLIIELRSKGFEVYNIDINTFLENFEGSLEAITAFQVIEHMTIPYLKRFLELSYQRLKRGGIIILETVNPWNIEAFARFYIDETHVRPVVPEYLYFLLKYIGFKNLKVVYTSPLEKEIFSFQKLKQIYVDYAIIGKKEE